MNPPPSLHKHIVLVGFMGTGKSSIGRLLAAQLDRPFFDTDTWIEEQYGKRIPEIFAQEGEAAFRRYERESAEYLTTQKALIVAVGGGFVTQPATMAILHPYSYIYCLTAEPQTIYQRTKKSNRPLLQVADPLQRIEQLLAERAPFYAPYPQIVTDGRSKEECVNMILALWQNSVFSLSS